MSVAGDLRRAALKGEGIVPAVLGFAARTPALWLTGLVGASTAIRAAIGLRSPSPWILPDEVVYSELAKSIAEGGQPSIRGVSVFGWGEVYPTLIAPAWAVFDDPVSAYHAALVVNAFVMSTAAIPAYLLARLFVSRRLSFVVAFMTLLVPSMTYTGVVMTENAFYPVFLVALYLVARTVREPTLVHQVLALLGLLTLAFTRIQGIALLGGFVGAVAFYALLCPRADRLPYLRHFTVTAIVVVPTSLAPFVVSSANGDGLLGWLGVRSATFDALEAGEVTRWLVYLVAGLLLYVAVAPVAAVVVMVARGLSLRATESQRLFAAVALPTIGATLVSVAFVSASFDVDGHENLNERYIFYVVPLLFVGLAIWIEDDLPRPRPWAWLIVVTCTVLAMILPIDRLAYNAEFQSVSLLPWTWLLLRGVGLAAALGAFASLCGALWLLCRRDRVGRMWLVVGAWMALVGGVAIEQAEDPSAYFARAYAGKDPDWVDRAVPRGTIVPVVWDQERADEPPDQFYFWLTVTEFFNESVGDVYTLEGRTYYDPFLPSIPASLDGTRPLRDANGRLVTSDFVLTTCRTPIEGTVVADVSRGALQLVEVGGVVRRSVARPCPRTSS